MHLGFGLLVGQNKQFEDMILDLFFLLFSAISQTKSGKYNQEINPVIIIINAEI